jgi:hypothetical protein
MVWLIRVARVLALLLLTLFALSFLKAMAGPETGLVGKTALLMMVIGCVVAAVKIHSLAVFSERCFQHH